MLGHRGIGSAAVGGQPGPAVSLRTPAILTISGVECPTWMSLSISDTLGGRSTASAKLVDHNRSMHPLPGAEVRIKWNDQTLFAGTVESVEETVTERNDDQDVIFADLRCVDWNQVCDRYYVSAAYLSKTLEEILTDVINIQTPMHEDGITLGSIADAGTIEKVVFNYVRVNNVFRDLAELTGLAWNIDFEKRLHFFERTAFPAPLRVGDNVGTPAGGFFTDLYWTPHYFSGHYWPHGSETPVAIAVEQRTRNMTYAKNRSQYRNREWLRAGHDLTDARVEYLRGDSSSVETGKRRRTFNLAYEVGDMVSITRDGVTQRLGVRAVDKDGDFNVPSTTTWPQWFYAKGEKEISQNSKEDEALNPTLTDEDLLAVTYRGRFPMIVEEVDDDEITARKAQEGGSGIYEFLDEDTNLDGRELGKLKAQRLLALYGRIPAQLEVEVDLPTLVPGHILEVTVENFGINSGDFLVDQCQISFPDRTLPRCKYTLLDGERQGYWADFYRKWAEAGRRTVIRENEVAVKTARVAETVTFSDNVVDSINGSVLLEDFSKDPYTFAMCGVVVVSGTGEEVPMALVGRSRIGNPYGS